MACCTEVPFIGSDGVGWFWAAAGHVIMAAIRTTAAAPAPAPNKDVTIRLRCERRSWLAITPIRAARVSAGTDSTV
jgi:hypothetical protein